MHQHVTRLLATALILTAAACTTSGSDDKPAATTKTTSPAGKLSAAWTPKLKAATKTDTGICNQAGDQACAEHLTDIALVVDDLETAINGAGGAAAYPKTTAQIGKVNAAVEAYTEHECLGDENASIQGSPCPDDARTIMAGGEALQLALAADEAG
ncbi:hypothetical protein ACH4ZX_03800 [Streptomyces sp. NPDC020490]|uniref:hypothetical protein n=1 Tax=Streptomyces sp. NPDC020490 TaxID=3365078 RepID=UPI00378B4B31